ncbi:MAG: hypothetical protein ACWA44_06430 [Thiotrichales bacterium]
MIFTIILFVLVAGSMVVCNLLAKQRGRDPVLWTVIAAIVGPLAIPFIYFLKPVKPS